MHHSDWLALANILCCLVSIALRNISRKTSAYMGAFGLAAFVGYNATVPPGYNIRVDLFITAPLSLIALVSTIMCIKYTNSDKMI